MKWRIRGLLIVGVLASVATSSVPDWELTSNDATYTSVTLTSEVPTAKYLIHAELRGPGPFPGIDGWVAARMNVAPAQSYAATTIEIRSLTHPEVMPVSSMVPANVTRNDVFMDAWLDCPGDPCAEDFEVTISRDPAATEPFTVTGYTDAYANGDTDSKETPVNSEIVVTVTGPL
jgi:hypothetical protein